MDPFIGEIRAFPYNFAPVGWLYCDGSLVSISDYQTLYALLGTTYGGDGSSTFGLPDLRGRVPTGVGEAPLAQLGGAEEVGLTSQQTALHSHPLVVSDAGSSNSPVKLHPGLAGVPTYGTPTGILAPDAVVPSFGAGAPHANVQPYLAIAFCISTEGIYPTPN